MASRFQQLNIQFTVHDTPDDLSHADQELLKQAQAAAEFSYSPYSCFQVGAAARLASGTIVMGSNQENIAYPAGQCAESVTLFTASTLHPGDPVAALAVTTVSGSEDSDELLTPCGVCRQVISEFTARQSQSIRILMRGRVGPIYEASDIRSLLPLMFEHTTVKKA